MRFIIGLTLSGASLYIFISNFAIAYYLTYNLLLSSGLAIGMLMAMLLTFLIAKKGIKKMGYCFPFIGMMIMDKEDQNKENQ